MADEIASLRKSLQHKAKLAVESALRDGDIPPEHLETLRRLQSLINIAEPLGTDRQAVHPSFRDTESEFVAPGTSGGGLFNENRELVGMVRKDNPPYGETVSIVTARP